MRFEYRDRGTNRKFTEAFDNFFGRTVEDFLWGEALHTPNASVFEDSKTYEISIEVPGWSKKDLKLEVIDDVLKISGTKGTAWSYENRRRAFMRSFFLPQDADPARIKAKCRDGMLYISLPKKELNRSGVRSIPIEGSGGNQTTLTKRFKGFWKKLTAKVNSWFGKKD